MDGSGFVLQLITKLITIKLIQQLGHFINCNRPFFQAENESGVVGLIPQNYISTFASMLTVEESTHPTHDKEGTFEESILTETNRVSILRAAPPPPAKKEDRNEDAVKEVKTQPNLPEPKVEPIDEHKTETRPVNLVKLADKGNDFAITIIFKRAVRTGNLTILSK